MSELKVDPKEQARIVNEELETWASSTREILVREIKRRGQSLPRETIDKLHIEIMRATAGDVAKALVKFPDASRVNDFKGLEFINAPISRDIHFLYQWVMSKGVSKFQRGVPGYGAKRPNISDEKKAMRIANAIVQKRTKLRRYKPKAHGWYSSTMYKSISYLRNRLRVRNIGLAERMVAELTESAMNVS